MTTPDLPALRQAALRALVDYLHATTVASRDYTAAELVDTARDVADDAAAAAAGVRDEPERLIFASVAARLDAGTYRPRGPRQPSHVPARLVRRARAAALVEVARELVAPALSCALVALACLVFFAH